MSSRNTPKKLTPKTLGLLAFVLVVGILLQQWLFNKSGPSANAMSGGVPITSMIIQPEEVEDSSNFLGEITSDEATAIHTQIGGRIEQVLVSDGQAVSAGQALFRLDGREQAARTDSLLAATDIARHKTEETNQRIANLKAQKTAMEADVDFQRKQTERYEALSKTRTASVKDMEEAQTRLVNLENQLVSLNANIAEQQAQLKEVNAEIARDQQAANSAQANLSYYIVRAPYSGRVGDILAKEGDVVDPGVALTMLTGNGPKEVSVALPAASSHRARIGMPLRIKNSAGELLEKTTISAVMPSVDPGSQTVIVKGTLPASDKTVQVDERLELSIIWGKYAALLVPASAVIRNAGQPFVYVVEPEKAASSSDKSSQTQNVAHLRPITLGRLIGNAYVVKDGLKEGARIVTGGIQKLRGDGVPVQELPPEAPQKPEAAPPGDDSASDKEE